MGLRNAIANWLLKAAEVPGAWHVPSWQTGRAYSPSKDYRSLVQKYAGWEYACARLNAMACADVPLRLYVRRRSSRDKFNVPTKAVPDHRKQYFARSRSLQSYMTKAVDVEEVTEHPLITLLNTANRDDNGYSMAEMKFLCQELTGNAYWKLVFNGFERPEEIWTLFPQFVTIVPDRQKYVLGYEYKPTGDEKILIEPNEVVHFKYPNPANQFYGLGPLEAAVLAADLSSAMNEYETALMKNRAQPDMALVLPEKATMGKEERRRTYTDWRQRFGGYKKAGKLAIVTGGAELKPVSLTPKEMNFLQGRKASLNEMAAIHGIPMSKLTPDNVNKANAEVGEIQHARNAVRPRVKKDEQRMNERLVPLFDDRGLIFLAYDNPVPEDMDYALKERETNIRIGFSTINEERAKVGMEPVAWGDEPRQVPSGPQIGQLSGQTFDNAAKSFRQGPLTAEAREKAPRTLPPLEHPTNFVDWEFVGVLRSLFDEQRDAVLAAFDRDMKTAARRKTVDDWLSGWFDMTHWNTELVTRTGPLVRRTLITGGIRSMRRLVADREFDAMSPEVQQALAHHRNSPLATMPNDTTVKRLRKTLADGIAAGEGAADLRRRIEETFDSISRYGAERIARTESIWAWNEGAVQGYRQSTVVEKMTWISSNDDRSCDFCPTMDGKVIGVNENFFNQGDNLNVGDSVLRFDYEPIGHPPLHPQCRCAIAPIIEVL